MNTIKDEIQHHMARAFFASAWADQCDESENAGMMSGRDIMDIMPDEMDPAALGAAYELVARMETENGKTLFNIYSMVCNMDHKGDRSLNPETFGHYCAMQAIGHGVGLNDAFGNAVYETVNIPYMEFGAYNLERDYFKAGE